MQINLLFHIGVIVIPLHQSSPGLKAFLVETGKSKGERTNIEVTRQEKASSHIP